MKNEQTRIIRERNREHRTAQRIQGKLRVIRAKISNLLKTEWEELEYNESQELEHIQNLIGALIKRD